MTPWLCETSAAPEVAALHWHDKVRLYKHEVVVVDTLPARQWQSCPAHWSNLRVCTNSLMPCSRVMGIPKPWGWGSAQSCAEHTGHTVPNERDLLNVQHLLHWRWATTYHEKTWHNCQVLLQNISNTKYLESLLTGTKYYTYWRLAWHRVLHKNYKSKFHFLFSSGVKQNSTQTQCLKFWYSISLLQHSTVGYHYSPQPAHPDSNQPLWSQEH